MTNYLTQQAARKRIDALVRRLAADTAATIPRPLVAAVDALRRYGFGPAYVEAIMELVP